MGLEGRVFFGWTEWNDQSQFRQVGRVWWGKKEVEPTERKIVYWSIAIRPFKMHNSVVSFSIFTELFTHHYDQFRMFSSPQEETPTVLNTISQAHHFPKAPGNHQSTFCLSGFLFCSEHFTSVGSCNTSMVCARLLSLSVWLSGFSCAVVSAGAPFLSVGSVDVDWHLECAQLGTGTPTFDALFGQEPD